MTSSSVALLRGINVGGKNLIAMPELVGCFQDGGYPQARSVVQSGNVLFDAQPSSGPDLEAALERMLADRFGIPVLVVVRSHDEFAATVAAAPADHGSAELRSEVFFLKHPLTLDEAWAQLPELREGVDAVAPGPGAIYFSRVAARATTTRITRFMSLPVFQQVTVRSWRTVTRLMAAFDAG